MYPATPALRFVLSILLLTCVCLAQDTNTLKMEDTRLNQVYQQRLEQLRTDPSALASVRQQERDWIKQRDHQCGSDVACLTQATKAHADYFAGQIAQNDPHSKSGLPIPAELQGTWNVHRTLPTHGVSCWDEQQFQSIVGTRLEFRSDGFSWSSHSLRSLGAKSTTITAQQFADDNSGSAGSVSFHDLGIGSEATKEIEIQHPDASVFKKGMDCCASVPGDTLLVKSRDTIILNVCGNFYEATRTGTPVAEDRSADKLIALEPQILVGVIEPAGQTSSVRLLFERDAGRWRPIAAPCATQLCLRTVAHEYPQQVRWTLLRHSAAEAMFFVSHAPTSYALYADQGLQRIVPSAKLAPYQLASSLPGFSDPDNWTPAVPAPAEISATRAAFRHSFPHVNNCADPQSVTGRPWPYTDHDIKITAALHSQQEWQLLKVELKPFRCDGVLPQEFLPQWFAVSPAHLAFHIAAAGLGFTGAGDIDNSGRSKIVFCGNDEGTSCRLFSADFKQLASVRFAEH